jgi:phospholipid/cholesterol/gamma-HCH transport system ATP-binding protein
MYDKPDRRAKLVVQGLTIGYGEDSVQHDLSFEVKPGSIFAIMGASGSGKSTVLKALIGLHRSGRWRGLLG